MIKERIIKILMCDNIVECLNKNLDIILELIPEIKDMIGFEHNHPHHHLDVWDHTLLALSISPKDFEIRLILLLHDIGKPHSYQDEKVRHFRGHPIVSSKISFKILTRLGFNETEVKEFCYLIEQHDNPITKKEIIENKELAIKKFKIQVCDGLAHNPEKLDKRKKYLLSINEKINIGIEKENYDLLINNFCNDVKKYVKKCEKS